MGWDVGEEFLYFIRWSTFQFDYFQCAECDLTTYNHQDYFNNHFGHKGMFLEEDEKNPAYTRNIGTSLWCKKCFEAIGTTKCEHLMESAENLIVLARDQCDNIYCYSCKDWVNMEEFKIANKLECIYDDVSKRDAFNVYHYVKHHSNDRNTMSLYCNRISMRACVAFYNNAAQKYCDQCIELTKEVAEIRDQFEKFKSNFAPHLIELITTSCLKTLDILPKNK